MELITSVCYRDYTVKSNSKRWDVSFVPTVLELNLQDVGSIGRIFRVLGHHVQVSWSMLLKNTQIDSISHMFYSSSLFSKLLIPHKRRERRREDNWQLQRRCREEKRGWWMKRRGLKKLSVAEWTRGKEIDVLFGSTPLFGFIFLTLAFHRGGKKHWEKWEETGKQTHLILTDPIWTTWPQWSVYPLWWNLNALKFLMYRNCFIRSEWGS